MILGIGVDTILISRIKQALERHGQRFPERILTPRELARFVRHAQPERYLAKRFAVKEAFSKAVGMGIHDPVYWRRVGTTHDPRGAPLLEFHPLLEQWLQQRGVVRTHVSVTDERDQAIAFVIVEGA